MTDSITLRKKFAKDKKEFDKKSRLGTSERVMSVNEYLASKNIRTGVGIN